MDDQRPKTLLVDRLMANQLTDTDLSEITKAVLGAYGVPGMTPVVESMAERIEALLPPEDKG